MHKSVKLIISLCLSLALSALPLVSCADNANNGNANNQTSESQTAGASSADTDEYKLPTQDFGGTDFRILNPSTTWNFYTDIEITEQTGDALDDAIYARNLKLNELYNVNVRETAVDIGTIEDTAKKSIMAGEDSYDIIYYPGYNNANIGTAITQNMFYNLKTLPELHLNEKWWDQGVVTEGTIGKDNALYFASNDVNITALQGAWCLYFNEEMMRNLGLDLPYDLVRSGKWTLDEFQKYMKAGANLNGQEKFNFDKDGPAVYGLTSFDAGAAAMLIGTDARYITKSADGSPQFTANSERFINACQKIAGMLGVAGEYIDANDTASGKLYETIFQNGKALFAAGEIKGATVYRAMETAFGIVPMPKMDDTQANYHSMQFRQSPLVVIPVTNQDPNRAALLIDSLAYLSHRDVTPVFYDVTVSQKGLRNEDSIEMLEIIRSTRFFDAGLVYGWTTKLNDTIKQALVLGKGDVVSSIEKNIDAVNAEINKTLEALAG